MTVIRQYILMKTNRSRVFYMIPNIKSTKPRNPCLCNFLKFDFVDKIPPIFIKINQIHSTHQIVVWLKGPGTGIFNFILTTLTSCMSTNNNVDKNTTLLSFHCPYIIPIILSLWIFNISLSAILKKFDPFTLY